MDGLYAIVDVDTSDAVGLDPVRITEALLQGGATLLQLRAKNASSRDTLAWLRAMRPLARAAGVPLIANDRADLAVLAGCDGVHLGQEDLPVAEVRRAFPELQIGVSTHNVAQLERAIEERPDYIAVGPIFETRSKANPDPVVGLELLRQLAPRVAAANIPLVAIGGISEERIDSVRAAGALPAVIGALMPAASCPPAQRFEEIVRRTRLLCGSAPAR